MTLDDAGAPADLELRITTDDGGSGTVLRYGLHSPAGTVGFTYSAIEATTRIRASPAEYQRRMLSSLDGLGLGRRSDGSRIATPEGVDHELEVLGHELYKELFPKELRFAYREFRERAKTLLIVSDEPWIPWELIKPYEHDFDDDFLCCRFELSRWLAGDTAPTASLGSRDVGVAQVAAIQAGAPPGVMPLPSAGTESALIRDFANRHSGVEAVILDQPDFDSVEALLRRGGFGVLHFIGHSEFEAAEPNVSRFLLADGRSLRPRDLHGSVQSRLREDRPLVIFNSCQAAQQGLALSRLGGWVARWILDCGCGAFLGPQWSVSDRGALLFIRTFYSALVDGSTVGRAVLLARRAVRDGIPGSTDWLSYSIYAHPGARLRLGLGSMSLRIPEAKWHPNLSPPGALLRAEYGIVPFHGRETELADGLSWCRDDEPIGIRLYTGAGGMGKTRFALELCRQLQDEGWSAGLYAPDPSRAPETAWHELTLRPQPALVVIDYAETRRDLLVPILRELYRQKIGKASKIRLLLLARAALDWWQQLQQEGDGVGELLRGPATYRSTLSPLALTPAARQDSFREAAGAFAARLSKPLPRGPGDLGSAHYERVLLLHMRALAAVEGVEVSGENGVLDYVLDRERRFWKRLAIRRELPPAFAEGIGRAMAAITLGGGADSEGQAVDALEALRFFESTEHSVLVQVARLLHESYPGARWIEPVMPDLLGEHLIQRELENGADELLDLVLGPKGP